jgi:hypothetical protein
VDGEPIDTDGDDRAMTDGRVTVQARSIVVLERKGER